MNATKARECADWLAGLDSVKASLPVSVTIGKTKYYGAVYITTDDDRRFYLLGRRPASYRRSRRTCYRFKTESRLLRTDRDWFVGGWYDTDVPSLCGMNAEEHEKYHPFGTWFGLHCWTHDSPIDRDEYGDENTRPYRRMRVTLNTEAE